MTVESLLESAVISRVTLALVHFIWQGAAIAVLFALVLRWLRDPPPHEDRRVVGAHGGGEDLVALRIAKADHHLRGNDGRGAHRSTPRDASRPTGSGP